MRLSYRPEIDGLRGLAILAVLGFHYFPNYFPSGFIGVDIFFVISGYLITRIVVNDCLNAQFSLRAFYARRVRRIFPALLITLLATYVFGLVLLLPNEFKTLNESIVASSAFLLNFLLIRNDSLGYFNASALANPLLHLWSLSIEEQFYIVWPIVCWGLLKTSNYRYLSLLITVLLLCCDLLHIFDHTFTRYYFPGTRFWEISFGSSLAMWEESIPAIGSNRKWEWSLLVGTAFAVITTFIFRHYANILWPGSRAVVLISSTVFIIWAAPKSEMARRLLSNKHLVLLGLISFPLYLYHWPFLGFYELIFTTSPGLGLKILFLLVAVCLAYFTYRYVEVPARKDNKGRVCGGLLLGMMFVTSLAVVTYCKDGFSGRYEKEIVFNDVPKDVNFRSSSDRCLRLFGYLFLPSPNPQRDFCLLQDDETPGKKILFIGDSHASKLYQGFLAMGVKSVSHIGRGSCPPIQYLNPDDPWYNCQPTTDRVIGHALSASYDLIILAGVFERYFDGTYQSKENIPANFEKFFRSLGESKKNIVIVLDDPALPFPPQTCLKRPWGVNENNDCSFDREIFDSKTRYYKSMFKQYGAAYANIKFVDASDSLCDERKCYAINSEGLLYTGDNNHLSVRGASLVDRQIMNAYPQYFLQTMR